MLGETLLREKPSTGLALDAIAAAVQPGDLATLIYTSGTTGQPKGVMLSHTNLISNCMAIVPLMDCGPTDRAISFLPLCHIFERTLSNAYLYSGMSIYYAESLEKVGANLREVRPDFFAIVPRVLEKMFERIVAKGNELTGRRRQLFFWALELAERIDPEAPVTLSVRDKLRLAAADRLIFSKWRAAFGGKVNGMVCGSAALNPRLARIFLERRAAHIRRLRPDRGRTGHHQQSPTGRRAPDRHRRHGDLRGRDPHRRRRRDSLPWS